MRLILGRSGSGKSLYCMNEIKKYDEEAFSKPLLYIVPEQFSFEAERNLISVLGKKGMINSQVLSFKRLAYKIFTEKGFNEDPIGNAGKTMLIYSIMTKNEDKLALLKNVSKNIGLVDTVVKQIEELKRYHITPEILENIKIDNQYLMKKLSDILVIYREYENRIKEKYLDGNDELKMLATLLEMPTYLDGAKIWVDAFDGFTPEELSIIEKLEKKADVTVSLIVDDGELFSLNQKTIEKLKRIANISEVIKLPKIYRYNSKELEHLEENFLRYPYKKFENEVHDIFLTLNKNPYSEIENIACAINKCVREDGYRYEDIAILARDTENYKNIFQTVFGLYGIPYFLDDKRNLFTQPIILLILSLLDICVRNFSYESVFGYLKTNLTNVEDRDDIDLLENYVLKWGIRGSDWNKEWNLPDKNLEKINYIREQVVTPIMKFKKELSNKKTVKEIVTALYNYLIDIDAYRNIQNKIDELKKGDNVELATEHAQGWNTTMNILDEMVEVLGDESVSFDKFLNTLKMGISNHKIGIIPPTKDQVMIGDIERTRSSHVKVLFIVGINDGAFPRAFSDEGFINDKERNQLLDNGIEIAKDTRKLLIEENFNIYKAFAVPSDKLYLSYPTSNMENKALRPSFIIKQLNSIFPSLKEDSKVIDDEVPAVSKNGSLPILLNKIRNYVDGEELSQYWKDVYLWYEENDTKRIESITTALSYKNTIEYMNKHLTKKLYGENISGSVSKLEKYASCPFSYYLRYGLKAQEREVYRLENPDLGSFLHEVIDRFSKHVLENNIIWRELEKEESDRIVDKIIEEVLSGFKHNLLNSSARLKQLSIKLKRLVKRMIWIITNQIKMGEFDVSDNEAEFGVGKKYPAIEIALSDGSKIVLNGKVDRIDIANTEDGKYIRIIDYKSSQKQIRLSDVYYGIQLQLLTYLDAVSDDSVTPGGVLYLELNDPMIKSNRDMLPEEIELEIMKQLRMKGLILSNARLVKAMDNTMIKESNVLNLSVKSDGTYTKMPTASEEQLDKLRHHIRNVLKQIGEEMINGNIKNEPIRRKNSTGCDYCEYKTICQFDRKLGNQFKMLEELKDEEVWKRIERE